MLRMLQVCFLRKSCYSSKGVLLAVSVLSKEILGWQLDKELCSYSRFTLIFLTTECREVWH